MLCTTETFVITSIITHRTLFYLSHCGAFTVSGWPSIRIQSLSVVRDGHKLRRYLKKQKQKQKMHLIEKTSAGPTSSPEMAEGQRHNQQLRVNSRPWDYDTEDSGVDSVSSLAGLEADSSHATTSAGKASSVEYSAVIVSNNKVNSVAESKQPVQQRKSFLHTVYGGAQQSRRSPPTLDCNANQNLLRKNVANKALTKRGGVHGAEQSAGHDNRALESAKNHFLHSLLDDEETVGLDPRSSRAEQSPPPLATESPASSTSAAALDLLPELVQLLDAKRVMDGGLIELVGRDGTRASLRVTLAPPSSPSCCSSATSSVMTSRRNSFNSRLHRNSKRSSQRRCKQPEVAEATSLASSNKSASSSGSTPSLASNLSSGGTGLIGVQRPRSVRRRPSLTSHKKVVPGFSVSMAIPPSKVAILASKFNSLINESRRHSNTSATATTTTPNHNNNNNNNTNIIRDKKSSDGVGQPVAADPVEIPAPNQRPISSTWSWRLVGPTVSTGESVHTGPKRNNMTSGVGRSRPIDTIPEILDPPPEESDNKSSSVDKPRRKSHDLSQPYGGRFHSTARPLPSDPAGSSSLKNRESVYGTVMSIVKQAIRKFEKFEDGKVVVGCDSTGGNPSAPAACLDDQVAASSCSVHYQEPTAVIPEGIEPNNSFLWRDQKSMQSLIYEATSFNERVAATAAVCGTMRTNAEPCDYYEMGSSKYDTLRSRQSNAYDTLHHRNQSKSSSSSSSGYDEIQSPCSLTSNPSDTATSVKYDDVKLTPNCVTYDELSYLTGRRQSNGYDELMRSPLSTTSSGGYIDPGSSSALGYERILPPEDHLANAEQTEDEDGSTLRYEECGSPSTAIQASSSVITVTALPAIVCEDQLDSISYLYDDIRTVDLGRNSRGYGGCYSGSNHSYEPIYAHLGEGTSKMGGLNSSSSSVSSSLAGQNDKSSDTLSDSSVEGVHEVCSYKLTQMGSGAVPDSPAPSLAGTSTSTRTGAERRSETSDEWIDISDPDEPAWTVTRIRQRHEVTNASFVRRGHRASRRKLSIPKASGQQSWSQTMRTLVKNGFNKATTLSKRSGKDIQQQQQQQEQRAVKSKPSMVASNVAGTSNAEAPSATSAVHLTKSSARRLPSAETEASGTGSSQTWEDYG
ncbi:hypothetical protein OUZ56_022685 [Daphnia magna]|uniref:Uncharacterized protein n=2 Tax=Daphnia magna TaxID=35525 RepID=A0ABR0AX56_9CRUS|nr:hypothetical protein OUZ56_022685 [Daphnia magna]